jgi:dethiobiotin synthetase
MRIARRSTVSAKGPSRTPPERAADMAGLFVTGTDTGVGKTVLSAALLAAMRAAGQEVIAHKPAVTGLGEPPDGDGAPWPADHELLAAAAAMEPEQVTPRRYAAAVAPPLAAEIAGERLPREDVLEGARAAVAAASPAGRGGGGPRTLVVEGAGGLLSPLADELTVCDLAVALGLGLLIAARPGLGTINHTLLTLRSARAAGLSVRAVVFTPWPERPSRLESYNRETIARLGGVEVEVLARADSAEIGELARVGDALPWRRWLGSPVTVAEPA